MKTVVINVKMPKELKDTFSGICERDGYSASLIIREMIKDYIKKNGQADIFKGVGK